MPRYRVRLNDPNSEHFRVTYVSADTQEEAAAIVQRLDLKLVADDIYPQTQPYELAYVVERGKPIPGRADR